MENEIIELRKLGMGYREIAQELGFTKDIVRYYCKKNDLGGVRGNKELRGNQYFTSFDDAENMFSNNFNKVYEGKYIYVGGYRGCEQKFTMKCAICGSEQTRSANVVRHKKNIECSECSNSTRKAKKEQALETKRKQTELNKIQREKLRTARIQERLNEKIVMFKCVCKECGDEFENNRIKKYCSNICMEHYNNSTKKHTKRKRIIANGEVEIISLPRLVKRDNNICHLCGDKCDYNDKWKKDNGSTVYGKNYPSVDHLIPVSKGGTETWDNVKLAHCYCNSVKSAKSDYVMHKGIIALNLFDI